MGQTIVSVRLEPADGTVIVGQPVQLSLFGATRKGGTSLIPANMAAWSSSSPNIAQISRQGRLTPTRPGTVTITARHDGNSASAAFVVVGPADAAPHRG